MQLDQAERGFSFRNDGPLDMRMGGEGPSAADLVNAASERDLAHIIATLGEERFARNVARAIVKARAEQPITTTRALAEIIEKVVRGRPGEMHPATRTFQALRMFVNDELGELATALAAAERMLKTGGRLAVISFHSLEDRIVKTFLAERGRIVAGSRHQPEVPHAPPSFKRADAQAGRRGRRGSRRESARALGQAACRGAHRCGADRRRSRASAAAPAVARRRDARTRAAGTR